MFFCFSRLLLFFAELFSHMVPCVFLYFVSYVSYLILMEFGKAELSSISKSNHNKNPVKFGSYLKNPEKVSESEWDQVELFETW